MYQIMQVFLLTEQYLCNSDLKFYTNKFDSNTASYRNRNGYVITYNIINY